jgi:hypothetical protein
VKRLLLFTLFALAPTYIVAKGSEQPRPAARPSVSRPTTYVYAPHPLEPARPDVSAGWGFA